MKKIPTIFLRNPENMSEILDTPHPDCEWVFKGDGVATRKYNGTCCLIKNGKLFKRRELKKDQVEPIGFIKADEYEITGKIVGWVPVDPDSKEDKWHTEAYLQSRNKFEDGTYELVGPKIQGNEENYDYHTLIKHSEAQFYLGVPRTFNGLKDWLTNRNIEGLVFHHPDGRMGKIKLKDFGLKRGYKK